MRAEPVGEGWGEKKKEKKKAGEECGRASGFEMKECAGTNTHTHKKRRPVTISRRKLIL